MTDSPLFFTDEHGTHRIPQDGSIFECDFCGKKVFIPKEAILAAIGSKGTGVFCSETCANWFKGVRDGSLDLNKIQVRE